MKVVRKKPLGMSSRILLAVVIAGIILIPLIPLAVRGHGLTQISPSFVFPAI